MMKNFFVTVIAVIVIGTFIYGCWQLQWWVHYNKLAYSSQVQKDIKPLLARITALEQKVEQQKISYRILVVTSTNDIPSCFATNAETINEILSCKHCHKKYYYANNNTL